MHRKEAKIGLDRKMPLRGIILEDFAKFYFNNRRQKKFDFDI
ncbi:MAG TPA: hypothetical protein VK175_04915 [Leadbetterella sp.]|nr:hypothetical protein [Leadbetterella sp.]